MADLDTFRASQSEEQFLTAVIELANVNGWLVYHPRPARTADGGWRTALSGHSGFPDLVLVRPPELILWELKSERGKIRPDQQIWLDSIDQCDQIESGLIRPRDWDRVVTRLARRPRS